MSFVDDPFAALDTEQRDSAEWAAVNALCEIINNADVSDRSSLDMDLEAKTDSIPSGGVFVFDLETIPDESRFPRPVRVEKVKRADAESFSVQTISGWIVPDIKSMIPKLSESQLMALEGFENNQKKPRKGVLDAIADQLALDNADDFEAAMAEWKKLSFNPFGCRIVALGIRSAKHHVTMLAKNDDEERELLRVLWKHINQFKTRCGYNITGFDDAVLVMRSMLLGVEASQRISRKKFGDRASIDLMTVMFPTGPARKLKEVCREIGIVPPVGYEMSGDQVFDYVEAGRWQEVADYVASDAVIEFELYQRFSDYVLF